MLAANILGTFLFGLALAKTPVFDPDVHQALDALALRSSEYSFAVMLWRAVYAGWLIALMVWLLPAAESARIWIVIFITYLVVLGHFPHVIAGATETFYLALNGQRSWTQVFGGFLLPVLIGNTIGGVTLVAALAHAQIVGDKKQSEQ